METLLIKLVDQLRKTLPGEEAQYRMAPYHRERTVISDLKEGTYKPSAVMIVFCMDENDEFFIPLIERVAYSGIHSAQVSFPGGKFDINDQTLENTALRECFEEIGIKENIKIAGPLTRLYIPVSNFLVQPYVGVCLEKNPVFLPDAREVKNIIRIKMNEMLEMRADEGLIENGNLKINSRYYMVEEKKVWGATAMILEELKEVIRPIF